MRQEPRLRSDRSQIINSAIEEFGRLSAVEISLSEYVAQFHEFGASVQGSIYRQLEVEHFIEHHPTLGEALNGWPRPGDELGAFLVLEQLGRGALSRAYLCRQPHVGDRQVVIKVGNLALVEAGILGRLRHANIVPIHSIEQDADGQRLMLCMPFLGRSTLHDFIDLADSQPDCRFMLLSAANVWQQPTDVYDGPACPPLQRQPWGRDDCVAYLGERLAFALAHAHARGIVHGDIKPSNILLARSGEPLLMDFNLSGDGVRSIPAAGGTLPYMPPEQLRSIALGHDNAGYGPASDIFSLGIVLYEALTGRLPFPLDGPKRLSLERGKELYERQLAGFVPVRQLRPAAPRNIAQAIEDCLAFQPEVRIQSAEELSGRLGREGKLTATSRRHVKRHARQYVAAGIAAAIALTAAATHLALRPPADVRCFLRALDLQQKGNSYEAEAEATKAIHFNPGFNDARFARALIILSSNDVSRAVEQFHDLYKRERSSRTAAYLGYCFNLLGNPTVANAWYERALESGCVAPEVYNNLAVSYEIGGSIKGELERLHLSGELLRKALGQLPDSPEVRLNWISWQVRQSQRLNRPISASTLELCRNLSRLHPKSRHLQVQVAQAFIVAAEENPSLRTEALRFMSLARQLGGSLPPPSFADSAAIRSGERDNEPNEAPGAWHDGSLDQPDNASRIKRIIEPKSLASL